MKSYDVAVIGLGIVGASAAYAAAGAGVRVLALDAGAPGGGTSGTSFAWLNSVRKDPEVYHHLNCAGMAAHEALARGLGGDSGHHGGGSLEWAAGETGGELRERVQRLAGRGYAAEWISRERALGLEPGLAIGEEVREVAFYAGDAWLDAPVLIRRLLAAARTQGAEVLEGVPVRGLRARGDRVEAVMPDGSAVAARSLLICVGPSTQAFLESLGVTIPVGRVPGLLAYTSRSGQPLHRVVHAPGVHLRPTADGALVLGAEDIDGLASGVEVFERRRAELAALLVERAARVFPAARHVRVVDQRIGVRPMPGDRHTIAGRIPGFIDAWLIATHSGVTLGPLLGRLLAEEIIRGLESPLLGPFRPERFVRRASPAPA